VNASVLREGVMPATATVEIMHAQWVETFNIHDLDRNIELFTEDAMLFGSVDVLQDGRDAIHGYFGRRSSNVRPKSYPMPVVREVATNVVVTAGHVDFVDDDVPSPYRMTWVLVRHDGNWRTAQHHGSPRRDTR
jgi:uncharacterized protein (TIGR02246 family)